MTVDQARDAGYRAGYELAPPTPNPYRVHVPAWEMPRNQAGRAELERRQAAALPLARAWRDGYQQGLAARRRAGVS